MAWVKQKFSDKVQTFRYESLQNNIKFVSLFFCVCFCFRKELVEMWDKCYFGEAQRKEFTPAFDGMKFRQLRILEKCNDLFNNKMQFSFRKLLRRSSCHPRTSS